MQVRISKLPRGKFFFYPVGNGYYRLYIRGVYDSSTKTYLCDDVHTGFSARFSRTCFVNRA